MSRNKKSAFTLAELLVAVAVIGTVAAITIPQLVDSSDNRGSQLLFKKAYTAFNQTLKVSQAKYDYDTVDIVTIANDTDKEDLLNQLSIENILTRSLDVRKLDRTTHPFTGKRIELYENRAYMTASATNSVKNDLTIFEAKDGVYYIFQSKTNLATQNCTKQSPCIAYIDVNGAKKPNKIFECVDTNETGAWVWDFETDDDNNVVTNEINFYRDKNTLAGSCDININKITDIFPILYYGATVEPGTNAIDLLLKNIN